MQQATHYAYDTTIGDRLSVLVGYGELNLTAQLGYDAVGKLTSPTDPERRVTIYAYDTPGRQGGLLPI